MGEAVFCSASDVGTVRSGKALRGLLLRTMQLVGQHVTRVLYAQGWLLAPRLRRSRMGQTPCSEKLLQAARRQPGPRWMRLVRCLRESYSQAVRQAARSAPTQEPGPVVCRQRQPARCWPPPVVPAPKPYASLLQEAGRSPLWSRLPSSSLCARRSSGLARRSAPSAAPLPATACRSPTAGAPATRPPLGVLFVDERGIILNPQKKYMRSTKSLPDSGSRSCSGARAPRGAGLSRRSCWSAPRSARA